LKRAFFNLSSFSSIAPLPTSARVIDEKPSRLAYSRLLASGLAFDKTDETDKTDPAR
jgi:hypothetical protein